MLLTFDEIIKLLRDSVNIQNEEDEVIDTAYLAMSDDDIMRFVKLGITRMYPSISDIEDLPSDCSIYAVVLLAKIELYLKLAVLKANKVDMGADNNNYLKNDQRFSHYMKLVEEAREEYESWLDNEGEGTVQSYDVLLNKYSHTKRNYEKQISPIVSIKVSNVTNESFDLSWGVSNISHFGKYLVYLSETPIINKYADGSSVENKLLEGANLIRETFDIRNCNKEVLNLDSEKTYFVAVIAQSRNGVWGYKEVSITTLEELSGEEIDV